MASKKRRADELLFEKLALESIELARALIMEGRALSDDMRITGPAQLLRTDANLRVRGALDPYVSRGAHKLKRALEVFSINLDARVCMDIGASTGGFTDVMLRSGAQKVYALDVGYNLLDYRLRSDARVVCMERTNARFIKPEDFPEIPSFGATDVSFISLKAVLPPAFEVMGAQGEFVALIKPQFEAPREMVGENGIVRDVNVHRMVITDIIRWLDGTSWKATGLNYSPITGQKGNVEFLLKMQPKAACDRIVTDDEVDAIIWTAYDKFIKSTK